MKTQVSALLATLMIIASASVAQARHGDNHCDDDGTVADVTLGLITSTTLPPLTTTTLIACAVTDDAELNKVMIQREATMVTEENKIFVPSFLGSYADKHDMEIRAAAQDVLVNGVR